MTAEERDGPADIRCLELAVRFAPAASGRTGTTATAAVAAVGLGSSLFGMVAAAIVRKLPDAS
jgi:hypothetical protein